MSQGTRLLLFHDNGELKQIHFPKVSPLWFLAFMSCLILLTFVLTLLSLRLYHEKRLAEDSNEVIVQKLYAADARIQQLTPANTKTIKPVTFQDKVLSLITQTKDEPFDLPSSPLEFVATVAPGTPGVDTSDPLKVNFGIKTKNSGENVEGYVCGVFFSKNGMIFLPNSRAEEGFIEKNTVEFGGGKSCDYFRIRNSKWYEIKLSAGLVKGVVQVYSNDGLLYHVGVLQ